MTSDKHTPLSEEEIRSWRDVLTNLTTRDPIDYRELCYPVLLRALAELEALRAEAAATVLQSADIAADAERLSLDIQDLRQQLAAIRNATIEEIAQCLGGDAEDFVRAMKSDTTTAKEPT